MNRKSWDLSEFICLVGAFITPISLGFIGVISIAKKDYRVYLYLCYINVIGIVTTTIIYIYNPIIDDYLCYLYFWYFPLTFIFFNWRVIFHPLFGIVPAGAVQAWALSFQLRQRGGDAGHRMAPVSNEHVEKRVERWEVYDGLFDVHWIFIDFMGIFTSTYIV